MTAVPFDKSRSLPLRHQWPGQLINRQPLLQHVIPLVPLRHQ
jgi:hypothetical protein